MGRTLNRGMELNCATHEGNLHKVFIATESSVVSPGGLPGPHPTYLTLTRIQ